MNDNCEIQLNWISILFVSKLFISGMIFQKNVDLVLEWKEIIWNEMEYSFFFSFIATGEYL